MTSPTDLPHCWAMALENAEPILEQLGRRRADALRIMADGRAVYSRLLIPDQAALDAEAARYPDRRTTQEALLTAALLRLAARYPKASSVTVGLVWGGPGGAKVADLVTFGNPSGRAAA
ncbi:MAG: hypothetical protein SFU83_18335 [Meiothermus sp.]|nr:hypothetical protein [Meiothermus sp.]